MTYNFKKVHTAKDLTISISLIIVAVALFFINKGLAICLTGMGLFILIIYKSGYKLDDDQNVYVKKSVDLSRDGKESFLNFLNGKSDSVSVKEGHDGGSFRVDFYYNKHSRHSYLQMYTFSNYEYQKEGELITLDTDKVMKILHCL